MSSERTMTREMVCDLDDVIEGRGVAAIIDGRQIAIFRLPGDVLRGIANLDPFSGANVIARGLLGTDEDEEWFVASPMHKQRFRLADGRCLDDTSIVLDVFPVVVRHGRCYLER